MIRTALVAMAIATALVSCGGSTEAPRAARRELVPQWQDVFDGAPELFVVIRPQAIKRDGVYGTLWTAILRVAEARSGLGGTTALDAAGGCDEILVGISKRDRTDVAAIVLRGVPASFDARAMTDATGHSLFHVVEGDRADAKVTELELVANTSAGSLFVLPNRTWVGVASAARDRAREAFFRPAGRPQPNADPDALAVVRMDADVLRARLKPNGVLAGLARKLETITVALEPGKTGVVATLVYVDEDASAWAEAQIKQMAETLTAAQPARFGWLKDARFSRMANRVVVNFALPPRLLEELPNASTSDLPI